MFLDCTDSVGVSFTFLVKAMMFSVKPGDNLIMVTSVCVHMLNHCAVLVFMSL